MLVDAGARDITWVDPLPADIIRTPPAIGFTVATMKFQGRVTVLYERGLDLYAVELHRAGELVERVDEVFFDTLGETLERLIDDGSRSEEHTSELQSLMRISYAVFCLKKKRYHKTWKLTMKQAKQQKI